MASQFLLRTFYMAPNETPTQGDTMPKIKIAIAATVTAYAAWQVIKFYGSEGALMERFPDIHPDDVKAAHRKMFRAALKGDFANVDMDDEELMDHIFLSYVNNL